MARRAGGFSLLELAVAVAAIVAAMGIFLERLLYYQELAERAAMELVASEMRSAVRLKVAELLLAERQDDIAGLAGANPMDWLEARPANYRGALVGHQADEAVPGAWHFDLARRELVYRAGHSRHLRVEGGGDRLAFRVEVVEEAPRRGADERAIWARLAPVTNYRWF